MRAQSDPRRTQFVLPSIAAALLPFALLWLPPGHWKAGPLIAAALLTVVIAGMVAVAPWERLSARTRSGLVFAYLIVVALLRVAGGTSGIAPVALLCVFWVGLCGTRRQLWCMLAAITVLFVLPLIIGGPADHPPGAWRAAILFIAVSGLIGATGQALVARVREQHLERDRLLAQLHDLAHTDPLTGLPNRRAWELELERALAHARRKDESLSLAVLDIDNFKDINDRRGHAEGDSLLIDTARRWSEVLRAEDVLARIGGDEFALLMPGCAEHDAAFVLARIRTSTPVPYSCSVGLAAWHGTETGERLLQRADAALYDAKRNGRDRISKAA
ncbi:MAG TPA: GGDEF domain-containing protein [Solirubrobacteraceae bacterium]|nr:GGDEF domain-containing protein [Solirubrobacteraceae bacterium]